MINMFLTVSKELGLVHFHMLPEKEETYNHVDDDIMTIIKSYMNVVHQIYVKVLEDYKECEYNIRGLDFSKYRLTSVGPRCYSAFHDAHFRVNLYDLENNVTTSSETQYIDLMKKTLIDGESRDDRTKTGTLAIFGGHMRFDISTTIPLLTTKQVGWRTVLKELLWFLSGDTNSKTLERQGVNIWKQNTTRQFLDKLGFFDYEEGETGPLYGQSFRNYGGEIDQIENIVESLKTDPHSRRHVMTTYDPVVLDKCVLMPCHGISIQFYMSNKKKLSCSVYCRSSDVFLGLPYNIASYAMLTYIIAKKTDSEPAELIMYTGDTHIYKNHLKQVYEQLQVAPLPEPIFFVSDDVRDTPFEELSLDQFGVLGYIHHPAIPAPMSA